MTMMMTLIPMRECSRDSSRILKMRELSIINLLKKN
jgi:hypothetical protein